MDLDATLAAGGVQVVPIATFQGRSRTGCRRRCPRSHSPAIHPHRPRWNRLVLVRVAVAGEHDVASPVILTSARPVVQGPLGPKYGSILTNGHHALVLSNILEANSRERYRRPRRDTVMQMAQHGRASLSYQVEDHYDHSNRSPRTAQFARACQSSHSRHQHGAACAVLRDLRDTGGQCAWLCAWLSPEIGERERAAPAQSRSPRGHGPRSFLPADGVRRTRLPPGCTAAAAAELLGIEDLSR